MEKNSSGIITYFRTLKQSVLRYGIRRPSLIILVFCAALFFVLNQIRVGEKMEVVMLYNLFIAFLLYSGEWLRAAKAQKPELSCLYPAGYKRKAICDCIGVLLWAVVLFAVVSIILLLIILLPVTFVSCVIFDFTLVASLLENLRNLLVETSVQGALFLVFYAFTVYGLSLILMNLDKLNRRVALCACLAVCSALFMTFTYFSVRDYAESIFDNTWSLFDKIPLSPLWVALVGISAAGTIAFGFILTVKNAKPTQI